VTNSLQSQVGAALARIRNPRLDNDLLSAGMVRDLEVTPEGRVSFTFLLSRDFLKLIGLAILIALPIAWWGSRKWLENFTYRTSLSWWVFAAGGGALLLVALAILCIRTFKAAAVNPVESLRSE